MHSLLKSFSGSCSFQQKIKSSLGQASTKVLGAVPPHLQAQLPRDYNFDAHIFSSRFSSTHYGIMIPDLPEPYHVYSTQNHLKFQQQPFKVQFADDSSLSEENGTYHLLSERDDLQVNINLMPTKALKWFAHSAFYQHFSVLSL